MNELAHDPDNTPNPLQDQPGMDVLTPAPYPTAPMPLGERLTGPDGSTQRIQPREDGAPVPLVFTDK